MSRWGPRIASCKWQVAQPRTKQDGWQATDRLGLLIPAGTPPGRYTVELLVRPKGSERPLEASAADGKPIETPVPLFGLDVVPADQPVDRSGCRSQLARRSTWAMACASWDTAPMISPSFPAICAR